MPITRNKQVALYLLLSSRSVYRAMLEGIPPKASGSTTINTVQSQAHLLQRFTEVRPPLGITTADIATLSGENLINLFDTSGTGTNNISNDPGKIASALGMSYDPTDPECPGYGEFNSVSASVVLILTGAPDPQDIARPVIKYGPPPAKTSESL